MQQMYRMKDAEGNDYDVPANEMGEFSANVPNANRVTRHRGKDGTEYDVPDSEAEEFRGAVPDAQPTRRLSFADGSTRDFTMPELSKFLRSKEWREDERYAADREERDAQVAASAPGLAESPDNPAWAATKGAAEAAAKGGLRAAGKELGAFAGVGTGLLRLGGALLGGKKGWGGWAMDAADWVDDKFDWFAEDLGVGQSSGNKVMDTLDAIGEKGSSALAGLMPWMVPSLATANILAAGGNGFAQTYDEAIAAGADPQTAYDKAAQSGTLNLLGAKLMQVMPIQKFLSGFGIKGAPKSIDGLVKKSEGGFKGLVDNVATGRMRQEIVQHAKGAAEMGGITAVQDFLNSLVRQSARGEELDFEEAALEGLEAGAEGAAIGLGMAGIHAAEHGVRRKVYRERARQEIVDWQKNAHPEELRIINKEKFDELAAKRKEGGDISRADAEAAGLSPELGKDWRNGVFDEFNENNNRAKPDELQSQALDEAIAEIGGEGKKAEAIREEVLKNIDDAKELDDPKRRAELVAEAVKEVQTPKRIDISPEEAARMREEQGLKPTENPTEEAPKAEEKPAEEPAAPKAEEAPAETPAETPRAETPVEAPRSEPKEEGTTTPPKVTEGAEGGKSADSATPEPKAETEAPKKTAPAPTERVAASEEAAKKAKAKGFKTTSHIAYDEDGNSGSSGMVRHHHENGGRLYNLPVDVDATRANGGRVVLDKNDPAYGRLSELLEPFKDKLRLSKNGNLYFKDGKGVPKELRELLGRELKIGKNSEDPFNDIRSLADERAADMSGDARMASDQPIDPGERWRRFEEAYRTDRANYDKWVAMRKRQEASARERAKMQKAVDEGKMSQEDFDIWQHRQDMEAYREYLEERGIKPEKDEEYRAMERDLARMEEAASKIDYAERAAAEEGKDKVWDEAIGEIESGEGDFSPTGEYVKPFSTDNLRKAKRGDIIHFDHDAVEYELDHYDAERGIARLLRSDENGVTRIYEVTKNGIKEIKDGTQGQKGADKANARHAGGGRREPAAKAGGEAQGEKPKPADLALESVTSEQLAAEKARREQQAEIKKRQEAPLKGSAGETGQTLLDLGGAEGEDLFNRTQRSASAAPSAENRPQIQDTPLSQRLQDPAFKAWARKQGVTPTKDHLEMYDRQQAKGAFSVVKRWLRGVKAKFEGRPPTDADIGADDRAIRNVRGDIIGKWNKRTNEVTFYPGANAETVAHEIGWHATYDHAEKLAARGDRRLLDKLEQYAQNAPPALKAQVLAKYGLAADPRMLLDEVGAARFTADQAMKIRNETDRRAALKWYGKAWEACRDAYKSILTKMGFNKTSIDALNGMSPERAVEFMAKEMAEGKSIGKAEAKRGVDDALTLKEKYVRDLKDESQILHWADEMTGGRFNLHREQKLSHGMKQKANDKAVLFVEKLNEDMKAAGVKLSELDEYMRAKGAADTNRRIKALNGNEDGAGISDRDAATTVLQYERGPKGQAIKDLADRVWKLQKEGLMERVRAGLISAQFANDLITNEPHHVPRHNRFDANGEFTGYETNAELAAAEWHKAKGRTTDAGNAVGWILQEYCDAFSRGADNRVRQRLAQAVLSSNGVLGKATVVTPANEARLAEKTKHNRNGNAQVVIVKQGGQKVALELNGVRGEAVASFFTGRDTKKMPGWMHKLVRIWASTKTEWSPMFAIDNFRADTLDALLLHVGDEGLVKGAKQAGQHMKNAFGLRKDIVEYVKTGKTNNTLLKEAIDNGILIGGIGREGFTDANEMSAYFGDKLSLYGEEGLKRMARRGRMGAKNVVRAYLGWVETVNKTAELATRLADYKVQRDAGMQPKDAAAHARDITVDFNEKGRYTDITNTLYLFSNSTMGSAFRQMKALTGRHWKSISATGLARGFAEGLVEAFNGDEDEREKAGTGTGKDLNEFTRANSLYVRVGGTTIKTPFHAGPLSVIKYTGNCAARYMAGWFNEKNASKLSGKEAAANIGKEAAGIITHFLGLGGGGANIEQTLTPSVLQWLVQLGQNRDYADRPIQKPKYDEAKPNSANGRRSTAEPYKWFAEAMNRLGGGNEGKKGSVLGHSTDYAPEVYKIFAESFGGNVLRDITSVGQIIGTVSDAFQGKDIDVTQIPAVGRFVRRTGGNTQRYYERANQYRENRYELQTMMPKWTPEERKAFVKKHPWAAAPEVNKVISTIGELQKMEDGFVKSGKQGHWVKRKEPLTDGQKEKWKAARLRYQAKFLEIAEKHGGEH